MTRCVARIIMDTWADKMIRVMKDNLVVWYMLIKYVDDINIYLERLKKGTRWVDARDGKVEYREE